MSWEFCTKYNREIIALELSLIHILILGARLQGPKTRQTGRTVKFTSKDLKNWKFEGDFWAPDLYTMHEMPDLFKIGDWWYHIVTEYSDRSKMVYRKMCIRDRCLSGYEYHTQIRRSAI